MPALGDTLQDRTRVHKGSAVLLSESSRGWGQPGPGTGSWEEQNLKELLSGRKSCHLWLMPVSGWILLAEDVHSFQSQSKEAPELEAKEALPSLQKQRHCLG